MSVNCDRAKRTRSQDCVESGGNDESIRSNPRGLFVCFCDLSNATSGSVVRPSRMLEAFMEQPLSLDIVEGTNRFRPLDKERKRRAKNILGQMGHVRYDFCYIELPSGPVFHGIYRKIIRTAHDAGIAIGAYYRDARWMYPDEFRSKKSIWGRLKWLIIKLLHLRDVKVFNKYLDILYMPTKQFKNSITKFANITTDTKLLPPGCSCLFNNEMYITDEERLKTNPVLTLLYVGAMTEDYGVYLLLRALSMVNQNERFAKLVVVCPENMRVRYSKDEIDSLDNVEFVDTFGEGLKTIYSKIDIGVIPFRATKYNNLAMPIKLCEYISFAKPVLATDCDEITAFIRSNQVGWVVSEKAEALADEILRLTQNRIEILEQKENCTKAMRLHSWTNRCKTVLRDLGVEELLEFTKETGWNL